MNTFPQKIHFKFASVKYKLTKFALIPTVLINILSLTIIINVTKRIQKIYYLVCRSDKLIQPVLKSDKMFAFLT